MSALVLNWHSETAAVNAFVRTERGALHVRGGADCRAAAFMDHIHTQIKEIVPHALICIIDPLNIMTSTPLGILRRLSSALGVTAPAYTGASIYVGSNNSSVFAPVSVTNLQVDIQLNEAEEFAQVMDAFLDEIDSGRLFDQLVILVHSCHDITTDMRRQLHSSLSVPLFSKLMDKGARFIIQYSATELTIAEDSFPNRSSHVVDLPSQYKHDVAEELAKHIAAEGWSPDLATATGIARGIFLLSDSVQDVYANVVKADQRRLAS
jgi:hypothetical protein